MIDFKLFRFQPLSLFIIFNKLSDEDILLN
jgi:hypothetical protein